jgi:hypothetical protein
VNEQEKVKPSNATYFALDGNYGDADGIVIVDTTGWSEEDWTAIDEVGDADRANLAYALAKSDDLASSRGALEIYDKEAEPILGKDLTKE